MGQSTNSVFNDMFSREAGGAINFFQLGNQSQKAGLGDINMGADFWKKILSGDRSSAMSALSPEIGTISSQYQGARKAAAEFSGRSGGRAASLEESRSKEGSDIENLLNTLRPQAADKVTDAGKAISAIGLQNSGLFANMQSDALNSIQDVKKTKDAQQQASSQAGMQAVGQILGALLLM